jgi:hypothetical protein
MMLGEKGFPVVTVKDGWVPGELAARLARYNPRTELGRVIRDCFQYLPPAMAGELLDRVSSVVVLQSALSIRVLRACSESTHPFLDNRGRCLECHKYAVEDWGEVGHKVITTTGVGFLVDAWQGSTEMENMKYHGLGTGSTAEAASDSALVTELTTEYTGNVRATGSTTEASATVFRSVGSNLLDGTPGAALREHGLFSASSAGVLWDRTVYAAITLSSGDTLESTYDMSASSGG